MLVEEPRMNCIMNFFATSQTVHLLLSRLTDGALFHRENLHEIPTTLYRSRDLNPRQQACANFFNIIKLKTS